MKLHCNRIALIALALATSCASPSGSTATRHDPWISRAIRQASLDQAIVAQRTIFPYHFLSGSAELNQLGLRDLGILADHLTDHPGQLNVRRGDASLALYAARTNTVLDALATEGLDPGHVELSDGLPGGGGMASNDVLRALAQDANDNGSMTESMISGGSQ